MIDMQKSQSKTLDRRLKILRDEMDEIQKQRNGLMDTLEAGSNDTKLVKKEMSVLYDEPIERVKHLFDSKQSECRDLMQEYRNAATREDRKIAEIDLAHAKEEVEKLKRDLNERCKRRDRFREQFKIRKEREKKSSHEKLASLQERQHDIANQMALIDEEMSMDLVNRYRKHLDHIDAVLRESEQLNPLANAATGLKYYLVEHRLAKVIRALSDDTMPRTKALALARQLGKQHHAMKISKLLDGSKESVRFLSDYMRRSVEYYSGK